MAYYGHTHLDLQYIIPIHLGILGIHVQKTPEIAILAAFHNDRRRRTSGLELWDQHRLTSTTV